MSLFKLENLSIRWKLIAGFAFVEVLTVILSIRAAVEINTLIDEQMVVHKEYTLPLGRMGMYSSTFETGRRNAVDFASTDDPAKQQDLIRSYRGAMKVLDSLDAEYDKDFVDATDSLAYASLASSGAWRERLDSLEGGDSTAYAALVAAREDWQGKVEEEFKTLALAPAAARLDFRSKEVATRARTVDTCIQTVMKINESAAEAIVAFGQERARSNLRMCIGFALLCVLLGLLAAWYLIRMIMMPLRAVHQALGTVAQRDLSARVKLDTQDEFGMMAQALNHTLDVIAEVLRKLRGESESLKVSSDALAGVGGKLADAADQTSARTESTSAAVEELSSSMQTVSAASEQMSANLNTIASAVEEMSISVDGIAKNTESSRTAVDDVTQRARSTVERIGKLEEASQAIGGMVQLIEGIAEQTKLLALNATIEAARAGEAGKGFAVVASEVKTLAQNTAKATNEIRATVSSMQGVTGQAVSDVRDIQTVLEQTAANVAGNASAIEEQSATTREISSNLGQASTGLQEVNQNVSSAADVSKTIASDMGEVRTNNQNVLNEIGSMREDTMKLAEMADRLDATVNSFKF